MPAQRLEAVKFDVCKKCPKLIGYHSNTLSDLKTNTRLIIPTHMSIKAQYMVKIGRACSEVTGRICPCLQFLSQKYKNKQTFPRSYSTDHHHICIRCSHIQCASKLSIIIQIFQPVLEWQRDKENFSVKKCQFSDFRWLPWQCPLSNC